MKRILMAAVLLVSVMASAGAKRKAQDEKVSFLFVYFTGNTPQGEQICYALSDDGYSYTPLNGGKPVIQSDSIAFTQCVRDPHILRCEDGKTFYMVVTDMKSSLGWDSNRGIVLMKSSDLVHWTHSTVNFPTSFTEWAGVTRVWAPETVYDRKAGRYMVFYSLLTNDGKCPYDKIFYQYANKDFTALEGTPQILFDNGSAAIDGDIVFNGKSGKYHLFYKSESGGGIYQAVAESLTAEKGSGPGSQWRKLPGRVEVCDKAVEGVGVCKSLDGKSWVVMYDCYGAGHYQFCKSDDLLSFSWVADTKTSGNFTPRHGTIMPITQEEKTRLLRLWGQ